MKIERLMNKKVVTVTMDDSLKVVKNIFENTGFHHLLVVESDKLLGVISDRDVLKAISPNIGTAAETPKCIAMLNKKAHQIMSRKPITLTPDASAYDAISIFINEKISCIPIVNDEFKVMGILSWRDILKALEKNRGKCPDQEI